MGAKKNIPAGEPAIPAPPEVRADVDQPVTEVEALRAANDALRRQLAAATERPEDSVFVRALQEQVEQLQAEIEKANAPGEPLKTCEWTLVIMRSERHASDLEFELFVDDSCEPVQIQVRRSQHGPRVRAWTS